MFEIGNTLREARVRRNLTLQQVEEDTKIRVRYVQAMENEDFDVMPGATYVKGFLRTYSEYLALDPEVILGEYRSRGMKTSEIQEPFGGVSMLGAPRSHRGRNAIVFVAVICLLVLGVIWILGRDTATPPSTKPGALGITSPSPTASRSVKPTSSPTVAAKPVVRLTATGDCWMEVRTSSFTTGKVLFSGTLANGSHKVFRANKLYLRLGNPGAIVMKVDGKTVGLKSAVGPWNVEVQKNGRVLQGAQTQG
ncbi:MAG TPA: RodZ domain-containing protein [Thermoleophilia bacterium]